MQIFLASCVFLTKASEKLASDQRFVVRAANRIGECAPVAEAKSAEFWRGQACVFNRTPLPFHAGTVRTGNKCSSRASVSQERKRWLLGDDVRTCSYSS